MQRVRLTILLVTAMVVGHGLVPHTHPWDDPHGHGLTRAAYAQADLSCATVPLGALLGQPAPVWCYDPMEADAPTLVNGANSWLDEFNHGASLTALGGGYRTFEVGSIGRARHWRHADHWMVDVEGNDPDGPPPYDFGATMMRPDRTFRAINGTLVIEAEVAAGVVDYQGIAWPELVVTTAAAPTQLRPNGTYVYEAFPGHWTVGCRLQADGAPTCALLDNTAGGDSTARVWEISHFQCGNTQGPFCTQKYGGHPAVVPNVHRFCQGTDPDTNCRDRFRWEISADKLTLYVNGTRYMEHAGFDPSIRIPPALLSSDVYVYFGDFLFKTGRPVTRFHWDRIAINPGSPPGPAPGATATPTPPGAATPTRTPTAPPTFTHTPTRTPTTAPLTVTFDDHPGQNQPLNGQYPNGVIDWGSGKWFHARPIDAFTTKSVSFVSGSLSQSFELTASRRLVSLRAHNVGSVASIVTVSCSGQTKAQSIAPGQVVTITTGFSATCTTVTVSSTNGWDTNFDDIVFN